MGAFFFTGAYDLRLFLRWTSWERRRTLEDLPAQKRTGLGSLLPEEGFEGSWVEGGGRGGFKGGRDVGCVACFGVSSVKGSRLDGMGWGHGMGAWARHGMGMGYGYGYGLWIWVWIMDMVWAWRA